MQRAETSNSQAVDCTTAKSDFQVPGASPSPCKMSNVMQSVKSHVKCPVKWQTVWDCSQGCYCLVSTSTYPYYKGRTYIGYTVDPNRRVKQHNMGKQAGGANKTDNRGPWDMVLIIHGFMNSKDALRFEWAWQHPEKSRRVSALRLRRRANSESQFAFRFRVACHLLRTEPWRRAPLTVRWLNQDYELPFPTGVEPPEHMGTARGAVNAAVMRPDLVPSASEMDSLVCVLCAELVDSWIDAAWCARRQCQATGHLRCWAAGDRQTVRPATAARCPSCSLQSPWHLVVRAKRAFHAANDK